MIGSTVHRGAVVGGVALLGVLIVGGCGAAPAAPAPAPSSVPPVAAVQAPPVTAVPTTTTPVPVAMPVVPPKDGTNLKACSDGSCQVAIAGTQTFRVSSFSLTATPRPGGVDLGSETKSSIMTTELTGSGSSSSFGSASGGQLQAVLDGQDAQGRPVVTFSRG